MQFLLKVLCILNSGTRLVRKEGDKARNWTNIQVVLLDGVGFEEWYEARWECRKCWKHEKLSTL